MFFGPDGRSASPHHCCAPRHHKKYIPAGFRLPPLSCTDSARESRYSPSHRFLFLKRCGHSITQNWYVSLLRERKFSLGVLEGPFMFFWSEVRVFEPVCFCRPRVRLLAACRCSLSLGVIHEVLQFFAGLEEGNFLGGHFHFRAGLRISADSSAPFAGSEAPESADTALLALLQAAGLAGCNAPRVCTSGRPQSSPPTRTSTSNDTAQSPCARFA